MGLIAVVAVAARGHSPTGAGETHGVSSTLIFEFVLLAVVTLFIISLPLALWVFFSARTVDPMRSEKRRQRTLWRLGALLLLFLLLGLGLYLRRPSGSQPNPKVRIPFGPTGPNSSLRKHPKPIPFDWLPAIVILVIAVVGACVVAYLMFRKGPRRPPTQAEIVAELTSVLDESLDDLRAERDPRRAVIATYARMERTLAGFGFPRAAAEAPLEYLGRILRDLLQTSADAVSRLTALFERAKFSAHEIDPGMKNDAIEALAAVRDELRAAVP